MMTVMQGRPGLVSLPLGLLAALVRLLDKLGQSTRVVGWMAALMNSPRVKRIAFSGYTPTASDVIVATYAKSGTNWAMQIALQVAYYGDAEFDFIHDLVPWPDAPLPLIRAKLSDPTLAESAPSGLRVIKTHWDRQFVPYSPEAKYIVVVRDPKEVFVSGYFFAKSMFGSVADFKYSGNDWLDLFLSDRYVFGSWAAHTASWWSYRDSDNVLVITYNELKRNPRAIIQRIASLMQVTLTEEQREKVVEKSSFGYMRTHEDRFVPPLRVFGGRQNLMFRRGEAGASEELIDTEQQARIDRYALSELRRLGSDFPYTAVFATSNLD